MSRIARVEDDDSLSSSKEEEEEKREEEDLEQERGQHQHQQQMLNYDDDDDDENDEALQEIDALEEHLRTKRSTSTYRAGSIIAHASTFEAPSRNRVQPYRPMQSSPEAQLMMMTIVPNEPGAFEINGPPPPLLQVRQPHTAQIQRDEEPALSSNHTRVQTCSVSAVDSASGANGGENGPERYLPPLFISSNRRNKYLLPAFGLLAIVGVVVGCVVGIGRRNDRNHDIEKSGPGEVVFVRPVSPESQCLLGGNQVESDRYDKLLSTIVSEQPDMEMGLRDPESNARKALCWLVHVDALKIETTLGEEYRMIQRFTLALIYYHFVREDREEGQKNYLLQSNWLMAVHECDWDFLECRVTAGDVVTGAYLSTKRMAGIIPSELALLTRLEILELRSNRLTGWIPTELWTMTQLKVLALSLNSLTGEFPTELPNLTSLTALELGSDFLTGTLPDMSALTNLELISLSHNPYIGGPIPNMAAWSNLAVINLSDLGLTGTIPTYIESLSNLKLLTIATTSMTGTLLTELGGLLNLEALALNNGFFGGTVPSEIGNLTALRRLDFRDMRSLTGAIPSELGKLVDLEMLGLGGGSVFSGTMPTEVCALRNKSLARLTAVCYGSTLVCNCCTGCL